MSFMTKRKTFKIGQSHAVTLPPGWCAYYGDRIKTITILGHSILLLVPQGLESEAQKLVEQTERGISIQS